jgi:very-short-patch-repair endonuclease
MTASKQPERRLGNITLTQSRRLEEMGFSQPMIAETRRLAVAEKGWTPGTTLENKVMLLLSLAEQRPEQQYRIGRYRVDFAWPKAMVVLEADGWYHRSPEGAARDRTRDSWLRSQGWLVFRIDDEHGDNMLAEQVMRVSRFVRYETGKLR